MTVYIFNTLKYKKIMDHLRATFLLFDYQLDTIEENSDEFSSLIEYQKKGSKGQIFLIIH